IRTNNAKSSTRRLVAMVTRVGGDSCSKPSIDSNTPCILRSPNTNKKTSMFQSYFVPEKIPYSLMQPATMHSRYPCCMSQPTYSSPNINIVQAQDYRDGYANSVQVRASVWDFMLVFGAARQDSPDEVVLRNFQGVYISPQQAKALGICWDRTWRNMSRPSGLLIWSPSRRFPPRLPATVRYTKSIFTDSVVSWVPHPGEARMG